MKLFIASDIHGSALYCEQLLKQYEAERPDRFLLLGDILYHGPRNDLPIGYDPKKVIDLLNPLKDRIIAVRGNCDAEVDQMVLQFPIMADYNYICIDGIDICLTHGHIYNQSEPLPGHKDVLLCGHTHVPACEECLGFVYINPGSVSIPKADSRHSYMIYQDRVFYWKDLNSGNIYKEYEL